MMIYTLILAVLFTAVQAFPNDLQPRATSCNRDDCYRAVFNSRSLGQINQASSDCSSFMVKTVSQCTVTVTSTSTISVPVATSTTIASTQSTSFTTLFTPSPIIYVTSVIVQTAAAAKRDVPAEDLAKRALTVCAATTGPIKIPTYASTCSGAARFSSACACMVSSVPTVYVSVQTSTAWTTVRVSYTTVETSTSSLVVTVATTVATPSTSTVLQTSIVPAAKPEALTCTSLVGLGNPYTAANGKQFQVLCGSLYYYSEQLDWSQEASLQACIDRCSVTKGCNFVNWDKPPYNSCQLLSKNEGYYAKSGWPTADSVALLPPFEPYTVREPEEYEY